MCYFTMSLTRKSNEKLSAPRRSGLIFPTWCLRTTASCAMHSMSILARTRSTSVIRVYDEAANVIETHEHTGDFKGDFVTRLGKRHARG
jgi:hypothetical protein